METLTDYTIYCTSEQVKKALELGAQIETRWDYDDGNPTPFEKETSIGFRHYAKCPTAEQMICWIEKQFPICEIEIYKYGEQWRSTVYVSTIKRTVSSFILYSSRPEATLSAIDAALEYLTKNKG